MKGMMEEWNVGILGTAHSFHPSNIPVFQPLRNVE